MSLRIPFSKSPGSQRYRSKLEDRHYHAMLLERSLREMRGAAALHIVEDPELWRIAGLKIRERERKMALL